MNTILKPKPYWHYGTWHMDRHSDITVRPTEHLHWQNRKYTERLKPEGVLEFGHKC